MKRFSQYRTGSDGISRKWTNMTEDELRAMSYSWSEFVSKWPELLPKLQSMKVESIK